MPAAAKKKPRLTKAGKPDKRQTDGRRPPPPPEGNQRALGNPGGGRPTDYDPEKHPEQVHRLALLGASEREMAAIMGICETTMEAWKNRHPEFRGAIAAGGDDADSRIAQRLYDRAMDGDVGAIKHWLGVRQRRRGWTTDGAGVTINNTLVTDGVKQRLPVTEIIEASEVIEGEVVEKLPPPPGKSSSIK